MAVNTKVADTCSNHYLAAYNQCIELDPLRISTLFDLNSENPQSTKLRAVLSTNLGEDGISTISGIVQKIRNHQILDRIEQVILGMAFLECRQANIKVPPAQQPNEASAMRAFALKKISSHSSAAPSFLSKKPPYAKGCQPSKGSSLKHSVEPE